MNTQVRYLGREFVTAVFLLAGFLAVPAWAQAPNARGKISRNFYRMPYSSGQSVVMNQDYVDHGNTPAGDFGSMDMVSQAAGTRFIVAAAAGVVTGVSDNLNGCGCNAAYGPCGNFVRIQHANGESSFYLHLAQGSATAQGIANNVNVTAGQIIGIEGDVGWTCGGGSAPRTSSCVPVVPPSTGNCGPHLHWNVVRTSTGERVNPMTCGVPNSLYADGGTNVSAACSGAGCATTSSIMNLTLNAFGEWRVFQADTNLTASTVTVTNLGSLVLHAGNSVRMLPGFLADAGGYVRAEIGSCNSTAFAPPGVASPEDAARAAIDLSHETEGY
jgi:hypothetical protein